ncbi:MAG: endopeptidase La [Proteobacteria bacterium]|nr:endopeptidase La [Pseudomonadota bacterium]
MSPKARIYALLPLREVVVFPHTPMSLIVGRPKSVSAVNSATQNDGEIFLVTQKDGEQLQPGADDLHQVGTMATIVQTLHLPDGNTKVLVEGRRRGRIVRFVQQSDFFEVEVQLFEPPAEYSVEVKALVRSVKTTFERFVKLNRAVPPEMLLTVNAIENPERLADTLVPALQFKVHERQELLATEDVQVRLERIYKGLLTEIEFLQVEKKLKGRVKRERENTQREHWLNEQMKAIQRELGDKEGRSDLEELAQALAEKDLPPHTRDRAEKELRKLAQMSLMSAEATVVRNYLDWILALPWTERSEKSADLSEAAKILNEDHYGLLKVKERILEYLAVGTLVDRMRGPILCLVGPPGVGKTSLAKSVARATSRPFVRISLGGVRDEAEIRGHRRTYIGALPGKILHAMKRAEKIDSVFLLDEVDKMSTDIRGDPASALLEVLDPEQNFAFNDHYLDIDYDLSHVMFICTANLLQNIPIPMQDRLEVIELSGYTEREKLAIAKRYLLPKQLVQNGLTGEHVTVSGAALLQIIRLYTRESGVRELERQLAMICRKVARRIVRYGPETSIKVVTGNLKKLLGVPKYDYGRRESEDQVGLVKGLAVSPWGGELLNIEVATVPGKGKLILTGRLGDWLKESATAAFTYIRSRAEALHLDPDFNETQDFHIHYPGNPLRTDGPSAGIAMATALVSALTGIAVRSDTTMTGEITLRGRVLPIGGIKEKVLAAHRGGISRVLIPEKNSKDIEDIPAVVREAMEIIPVSHMDRVLREALSQKEAVEIFGSYGSDQDIGVDSAGSPVAAGPDVSE